MDKSLWVKHMESADGYKSERGGLRQKNLFGMCEMMDTLISGLKRALVGITKAKNFSWFSHKRALPPSIFYYEQDSPTLDIVVRPYPAVYV